jgi:hypothetical protein
MGSTFIARRAGSQQASGATAASTSDVTAKVTESVHESEPAGPSAMRAASSRRRDAARQQQASDVHTSSPLLVVSIPRVPALRLPLIWSPREHPIQMTTGFFVRYRKVPV